MAQTFVIKCEKDFWFSVIKTCKQNKHCKSKINLPKTQCADLFKP